MSDDEEYEEYEEEEEAAEGQDRSDEADDGEEKKEAAEPEGDAQTDDAEAQKLLTSLGVAGGSMSLAAQLAMENNEDDEEDAAGDVAVDSQNGVAPTRRADSSEAEDSAAQVDLDGVLKLDRLRIGSEQTQQLAESTTGSAFTAVSKHARMELTPDLLKAWERDSKAAEDELAQELANSTA